jgi:hypothetical protein
MRGFAGILFRSLRREMIFAASILTSALKSFLHWSSQKAVRFLPLPIGLEGISPLQCLQVTQNPPRLRPNCPANFETPNSRYNRSHRANCIV